MYRTIICVVLTFGLLTGTALAHGTATHVVGVVSAIQNDHVSVKTTDGKSVMVMVGPKTKFLRDKTTAAKADLVVGSRVVIDATMDPKMKMLSASEVRLGVVTAAAKPAAAPTIQKSAAPTQHQGH